MSHGDDGKKTSTLVSFFAGGIAGGVEGTATYPFEFAKTRVQLRNEGAKGKPASVNPFRVVSDVIKNEGFTALYKGCSSLVIGSIAKDGIRFLAFDKIKSAFKDPETGTLSPLRSLLAGMTAGALASTFAVTPTERIKTALIDDARSSGPRRFKGPFHASKLLIQEHGLGALYRGYATTTLKQMGTTSFRMGTYNILKDFEERKGVAQSGVTSFANGAVAGLVTTYATQPFDVVKTRAQSARGATTTEAFTSVLADYGVRGLWKGTVMRLGRTVFAGGILFTAYESAVAVLEPIFPAV